MSTFPSRPTTEDDAYGGVRTLVALHDRHLRAFVEAWKRARKTGVALPPNDDASRASLDAFLLDVLAAARGTPLWICERLTLPTPDLPPIEDGVAADPDAAVAARLAAWDGPLRTVTERQGEEHAHPSRWGTPYCVDAMFEHAVMHPLRHAYQRVRAARPER